MENGLRWIAGVYDVGYTFTLCEGITPQELLVRMCADPAHIHELTEHAVAELQFRSEDGHPSDLEFLDWEDEDLVARLEEAGFLSRPDSIVRAGAVPGWAYAIENTSCRATSCLEALSHGTRAYTVFRSGAGMQQVGYARAGQVLAYYEPRKPSQGRNSAEAEVPGFAYTGEELPDIAFLRFLEQELGIYLPWEETLAPLPTAAFARSHP
ncbi:DUF6461 domain-containing protein [Streptomyces sp. NBC_00038]|uniref:DUF6461 domain-containing protein n=1 Tax=Streptomyces sp. NBC_00038 TaxID=2903615 RepID=UPI002253CE60|nr:DUF6461 domain-containing protein [Streptomyces sp. NBC_00038]MCX5558917.1 DUF6461 domain-containing protein [Streptomyces sp. NBC_00038]